MFKTVIWVQVYGITMEKHFQLTCCSLRIVLIRIITCIKKYSFAIKERDAVRLWNSFCSTYMHGEVVRAISSSTQHLAQVQLQTFYIIILHL